MKEEYLYSDTGVRGLARRIICSPRMWLASIICVGGLYAQDYIQYRHDLALYQAGVVQRKPDYDLDYFHGRILRNLDRTNEDLAKLFSQRGKNER